LNVVRRIRGLGPRPGAPARRSPDIVLLAPARQSFTYGHSTHGALGYQVTRVPMMFFGPAIGGVSTIPQADMVDFAPSVLSLLGISSASLGLDGRPLVRYDGRPIGRPGPQSTALSRRLRSSSRGKSATCAEPPRRSPWLMLARLSPPK
jgi:hypothetical protein